jgi:L-asparagine transporter-like permease
MNWEKIWHNEEFWRWYCKIVEIAWLLGWAILFLASIFGKGNSSNLIK